MFSKRLRFISFPLRKWDWEEIFFFFFHVSELSCGVKPETCLLLPREADTVYRITKGNVVAFYSAQVSLLSYIFFKELQDVVQHPTNPRWEEVSETLLKGACDKQTRRWKRESKIGKKKFWSEWKKLTVASSLDANSLNWLPSVFSSAWSYLAPCNFICPLKTSVAGLTCLLMVAFEAASLTGERERSDES